MNYSPFVSWLIVFVAEYVIFFLFASCFYIFLMGKRRIAIQALAAGACAWLVSELFKLIVNNPRPYVLDGTTSLLINPPDTGSFPSSHTMTSAAIAWTIYFYNRKLGLILLCTAIFIGAARVLAWVHAPVDIVGGVLIGMAVAEAIRYCSHNLKK